MKNYTILLDSNFVVATFGNRRAADHFSGNNRKHYQVYILPCADPLLQNA